MSADFLVFVLILVNLVILCLMYKRVQSACKFIDEFRKEYEFVNREEEAKASHEVAVYARKSFKKQYIGAIALTALLAIVVNPAFALAFSMIAFGFLAYKQKKLS